MKSITGCLVAMSLLFAVPAIATAADYYTSQAYVGRIQAGNDGKVIFGTSSQPGWTCNFYGYFFSFDASTPEGKNMLATLLAAKLAGRQVEVWYAASTYNLNPPYTCAPDNLAVAHQVGMP